MRAFLRALGLLTMAAPSWALGPLDAHLGFPSFPPQDASDDPPVRVRETLKIDPICGGACTPDCTPELAAKLHQSCAAVYRQYATSADTDSEWQLISVDREGRWVWYNPAKKKLKEKFRSSAGKAQLAPNLAKVWGRRAEPLPKTIALFPWRLLVRPVWSSVATGTTAQRTLNMGHGLLKYVAALHGNEEARVKAGFLEANGLINSGGTLNALIDDTSSLIKSPFYAGAVLSQRIQLCYANLQAMAGDRLTVKHFLDPELHVGVRIDSGLYETDDPATTIGHLAKAMKQGGVLCHRVPLMRGESESIAIERLRCADSLYQPGWGPVFFNCAGYTADILKIAGLGFPGMPNAGIGNKNSLNRGRSKQFQYAKKACDERIESLRQVLSALELGQDLAALKQPATLGNSGPDARLQMVISAAKNAHNGNRIWVTSNVGEAEFNETYLDQTGTKLREETQNFLKQASRDLTPAALEWIKQKFPMAARILMLSAQAI